MLTNYKSILSWGAAALFLFAACEKDEPYNEETDSKDNALVFAAKSNKGLQNLTIFPFADTARTFTFGASIGMLGKPASPIPVTFAEDARAFDSLNRQRLSSGQVPYERFPADAYSIDKLNVTIPQGGQTSDLITVKYFSKKFDSQKDYLLPLSITSASGYVINPSVKTVMIVAPRLSERLASKTGWTATASSEELAGEGLVNGRASAVIDGDVNTFWHSRYLGAEPTYPHWINIDMKNEIYVTRVDLAPRQNNGNGSVRFNVEGSKDGTTWTTLGSNLTFNPANTSFQAYPVTPGFQRYIRVTLLEPRNAGTRNTHLGEVNIYRY
ncbi:hypothetical protein C7T94_17595 [Pedobacter yulinensis]|uniref:F5/8 type C domain-containing protein n=1 Tax=Pedobacter yulinensis TaxID=2126353 RepID=A0A2T3HHU4_9SPHI|nr:discoidin domain-containing protein [Pedobacter yulinensis]PST82000.1 hypothetical protein C7T94_17595 [Pedobacter yulinensis]